jgi:hypothetical protein
MDSDFAIVDLTPDLAAALGITRKTVLVEALAMTGAAVVRGVYVRWEQHGRTFIPEQSIEVPREHEAALESLFCKARRLRPTDDAATIREADYQHAKAPRFFGRVSHKQNPGGYRRTGGHR